jgi:predicted ATPase
VIDEMLTASDREPLHQLEARLRQLSPYVGHLGTRVVASPAGAPPRKEVTYSLADKKGAIPASQMSGGVVLLTAFLWLRYGTNHQRYLIEDPENGIHPRATAMLAAFLRELAYEDQRQVIITTHSPFLLNQVSVEDVLVVTRHETHGIRVTPIVDAKFFAERIKELDLGELWYNIGEDELVADAS